MKVTPEGKTAPRMKKRRKGKKPHRFGFKPDPPLLAKLPVVLSPLADAANGATMPPKRLGVFPHSTSWEFPFFDGGRAGGANIR